MSNMQKTLDSLQPYVIGIRYLEGTVLVDAVFKEGWTIPEDTKIKRVKGNDELNYYMVFSEIEGVGLDDLLAYVDKTIKLNLEREKKHDLLRAKVNELKEVFKKNSLSRLTRLKFTFGEEDITPSISDLDIDIDEEDITETVPQPIEEPIEEPIGEVKTPIKNTAKEPAVYLDENKQPIELTAEDREILEEEARAERNRKALDAKKKISSIKPTPKKIELPPKKKIEMAITERDYESDCECGPNEACSKCIDKKDF